jgi:hypothetical protein
MSGESAAAALARRRVGAPTDRMAGALGLSAPPGRGIHDRSLIIGYLPRSFDVPPAVDALASISHPPMCRPSPVEATGANDPGLRPGIASLEVAPDAVSTEHSSLPQVKSSQVVALTGGRETVTVTDTYPVLA